MTDRGFWVAGLWFDGNVRRLMYQSLIGATVLGNDARRLSAAGNAKDCKRLADALVDGVRRNAELDRDLFGRKQLVDEPQAVKLAAGQPGDTLGHQVLHARMGPASRIARSVRIVQGNPHPAKHAALSKHESAFGLSYLVSISQFLAEISPFSLNQSYFLHTDEWATLSRLAQWRASAPSLGATSK